VYALDQSRVICADPLRLCQEFLGDDVLYLQRRVGGVHESVEGLDVNRRGMKKGDVLTHAVVDG